MSPETGDKTVLIVDDEPDVADVYQLQLQSEYEVMVAYGGEEALETIDMRKRSHASQANKSPAASTASRATSAVEDPSTTLSLASQRLSNCGSLPIRCSC